MALKIADREVNGVAVLTLEGRIVLGEETVTLREKAKGLLATSRALHRRDHRSPERDWSGSGTRATYGMGAPRSGEFSESAGRRLA
jgi:hypothetical protein